MTNLQPGELFLSRWTSSWVQQANVDPASNVDGAFGKLKGLLYFYRKIGLPRSTGDHAAKHRPRVKNKIP